MTYLRSVQMKPCPAPCDLERRSGPRELLAERIEGLRLVDCGQYGSQHISLFYSADAWKKLEPFRTEAELEADRDGFTEAFCVAESLEARYVGHARLTFQRSVAVLDFTLEIFGQPQDPVDAPVKPHDIPFLVPSRLKHPREAPLGLEDPGRLSPRLLRLEMGTHTEASRRVVDFDGDAFISITDPITFLNYLFLAGPPPALGKQCMPIAGCSVEGDCR